MYQKRQIIWVLCSILLGMTCLTAASPVLYSVFCKATGYGGAVDYGVNKGYFGKKYYTITFNSDLEKNMNWKFTPEQHSILALSGENQLVFYSVENMNNFPVKAMAIYNITPHVAGQYFKKVDCFCFEEQFFKAHEKRLLPVVFFIDPAIEKDKSLNYVEDITLSYMFFKLDDNL